MCSVRIGQDDYGHLTGEVGNGMFWADGSVVGQALPRWLAMATPTSLLQTPAPRYRWRYDGLSGSGTTGGGTERSRHWAILTGAG